MNLKQSIFYEEQEKHNDACKVYCFQKKGQHHIEENTECEDVFLIFANEKWGFWGLADGQSNKSHCKDGARAVLTVVSNFIEEKGINYLFQCEFLDELQLELIKVIRGALFTLKRDFQVDDLNEFASTMVVLVINYETKAYMTIHIGDGAIITVTNENEIETVSRPENGILDRYTWLTTSEDAAYHIRIERKSINQIKHFVLITDGATMVFRDRRITSKARKILTYDGAATATGLEKLILSSASQDDASCILIEL